MARNKSNKSAKASLSSKKSILRSIFRGLFVLGIFLFVLGFFVFLFFIHDLPDINNLETKGRRASVTFESYDGKTIATYGDMFREVVQVKDLPEYIGNAIIAIEDRRFYSHCGIDFIGIARALYTNIVHRRIVQGGSTITQQLAKNLFLSASRSIKRKVQEFILALWLEHKFSKKQILSIYLNRVYFGSCAYGIDAAAYRYFGKKARQLSTYEAAKLAGVLRAPSLYSPFYNPEKSDQRTALVLTCMRDEGYISDAEKREALQQQDKLTRLEVPRDENRYFTDWALEQVHELVSADEDDIIVRTTLDTKMQINAAYVIKSTLEEHGFKNRANQMALIALDKSGAVRAMIGGYSYGTSQFNRVMAVRSSGSAFKYFVYLTALEDGMDIHDLVSDMPITIGSWCPKNTAYVSVGNIPMLQAFAKSVNTPAIRIARKVGMDRIIRKAEQLGISTEIDNNITSALGASGVNLLDITACFGATMINGRKMIPFGILSIRTQNGKYLYKAHANKTTEVISPAACEKMKILLREVVEKGTGRQAKLPITSHGKSGTSNDNRDASFIGFAHPLVVGVWLGNDDNTPMSPTMYGGFLPAIAWREFMLLSFGYKQISPNKNGNNTQNSLKPKLPNGKNEKIEKTPKKRSRKSLQDLINT
ncbi:MAG: PBP1A family penicillin-binding protein [Holosporaceae bacterium]|jgi:penicillin-binding protein 1A|nr:PBP1A family penicillin-binding protein [Holosporaceae bacterium]